MKIMTSLILSVFLLAGTGFATNSTKLPAIFQAPARALKIPGTLLMAIAKVESGGRPWTLNIEGQSYHFKSGQEAINKAKEALRKELSFDIGLMQINSWWLKRYGLSVEEVLDPLANVYFGSWILRHEFNRLGNIKAAIGAYHSPNRIRANRYISKVMEVLNNGQVHLTKINNERSGFNSNSDPSITDEEPTQESLEKPFNESSMIVQASTVVLVSRNSMKASGIFSDRSMKIAIRSFNQRD